MITLGQKTNNKKQISNKFQMLKFKGVSFRTPTPFAGVRNLVTAPGFLKAILSFSLVLSFPRSGVETSNE